MSVFFFGWFFVFPSTASFSFIVWLLVFDWQASLRAAQYLKWQRERRHARQAQSETKREKNPPRSECSTPWECPERRSTQRFRNVPELFFLFCFFSWVLVCLVLFCVGLVCFGLFWIVLVCFVCLFVCFVFAWLALLACLFVVWFFFLGVSLCWFWFGLGWFCFGWFLVCFWFCFVFALALLCFFDLLWFAIFFCFAFWLAFGFLFFLAFGFLLVCLLACWVSRLHLLFLGGSFPVHFAPNIAASCSKEVILWLLQQGKLTHSMTPCVENFMFIKSETCRCVGGFHIARQCGPRSLLLRDTRLSIAQPLTKKCNTPN